MNRNNNEWYVPTEKSFEEFCTLKYWHQIVWQVFSAEQKDFIRSIFTRC